MYGVYNVDLPEVRLSFEMRSVFWKWLKCNIFMVIFVFTAWITLLSAVFFYDILFLISQIFWLYDKSFRKDYRKYDTISRSNRYYIDSFNLIKPHVFDGIFHVNTRRVIIIS